MNQRDDDANLAIKKERKKKYALHTITFFYDKYWANSVWMVEEIFQLLKNWD